MHKRKQLSTPAPKCVACHKTIRSGRRSASRFKDDWLILFDEDFVEGYMHSACDLKVSRIVKLIKEQGARPGEDVCAQSEHRLEQFRQVYNLCPIFVLFLSVDFLVEGVEIFTFFRVICCWVGSGLTRSVLRQRKMPKMESPTKMRKTNPRFCFLFV